MAKPVPDDEVRARLRALPTVELHQHVDGSIPSEVIWEVMRENPLPRHAR